MTSCICNVHLAQLEQSLSLSKLRPRSRESYKERLITLSNHYRRCPAALTDDEILGYFVVCIEKKNHAAGTIRPAKAVVKFLFGRVLKRPTDFLDVIQLERRKKLPEIFSEETAWRILDATRLQHHRACMTLLYTCGLRISEAINLTVDDFDRHRQEIRIRDGKGGKDRIVPIPTWTLNSLRNYWGTHRNPKWIFPALASTPELRESATLPMRASCVRDALKAVLVQLEIPTKDIVLHTFRHSYATHLLDAGVSLYVIQRWLGHADLESTIIYLRLTHQGQEKARKLVEGIMRGPSK